MADPLIWASGYNARLIDAYDVSPRDRRDLQLIGGSVIFSTIWIASMCALAAWGMSDQASPPIRVAISSTMAFTAVSFVLVFDRSALFFMDTNIFSKSNAVIFGSLRLALVASIGILADVSVMPIVMKHELILEATQMQEDADRNRFVEINSRYQVSGLKGDRNNLEGELKAVRDTLKVVPNLIQFDFDRSDRCFAALKSFVRGNERSREYWTQRKRCIAVRGQARQQLSKYVKQVEEKIAEAEIKFNKAQKDYENAKSEASIRIKRGAREDSQALTHHNFKVFWHLVSNDIGAAIKAALLLIIHLVLDLLPFILKGIRGSTALGLILKAEKQTASMKCAAQLHRHDNDHKMQMLASNMALEAAREAYSRPSIRTHLADLSEAEAKIIGPIEQAVETLRRAAFAENQFDSIRVRSARLKAFKSNMFICALTNSFDSAAKRS